MDLKPQGLSLYSLLLNPAVSVHNQRVTTQKLILQYSVFRTTSLSVMKQKQDALIVCHTSENFCLHNALQTLMLAIPVTKTVEFCAFVYLKNERNVAN